jgi:3-oxoacyl-[acyl-carrier protein] reductase
MKQRPTALITGVSRKIGIGASIAQSLAQSGWDLIITYWNDYDSAMPWGSNPGDLDEMIGSWREAGALVTAIEADLSDPEAPVRLFEEIELVRKSVSALILSHCYSIDSDIFSTTLESFDRHFAVNTRAVWLLIREFALRFNGEFGQGRIISLTSDHTAGNLPYGASKGAMDRIVLAAAQELREKGITANVINPGATDTGWIPPELAEKIRKETMLNRIGLPRDAANLVQFLCSPQGGWINGQLLYSNGGFHL